MTTAFSWLPDAAWKGALLLALAWLAARTLRRQPAALRHLIWSVALAGVIAMPLLSWLAPVRLPLPLPTPATVTTGSGTMQRVRSVEPEAAVRTLTSALNEDPQATASQPQSTPSLFRIENLGPLTVGIWLAGAVALALRLVWGFIALRRISRAKPEPGDEELHAAAANLGARLGLRIAPRLVVSDAVAMPCASGWFRPIIMLPGIAREWSPERRDVVLLHELTHIRRGDFVSHVVAEVARMLYWFNPLVWIASRQLRAEAERATDERVVSAGARASEYAAHLLDIVRGSRSAPVPAPLMPLAQRSEFEGRLLAILEFAGSRAVPSARAAAATGLVVAGLTMGLASIGSARPTPVPPAADPAAAVTNGVLPAEYILERRTGESKRNPSAAQSTSTESNADALAGALLDPVPAVRKAATEALGHTRDSIAVRALIGVLRDDDNAEVRRSAAWSLGQIKDAHAVPALMEALLKDSDAEVRKNAAWALGAIESPRAAPALAQALEHDDDLNVRVESANALGELKDVSSVSALVRMAGRDDEPDLRKAVIEALQNIDNARAAPAIAAALRDRNADVRQAAAEALGSLDDRSSVPALMSAAKDSDADVRRAVIEALSNIGDRRAVSTFAAALGDADPDVRQEGADGLSNLENLHVAPPELLRAMDDRDAGVRQRAAHALGHIEDPAGLPALIAHVADPNVEVRRAVVESLDNFDDPSVPPALRTALRDQDAEVRESAARALGNRSRK